MILEGWKIINLEKVAKIQTGLAKGKKGLKNIVTLPYLRVANVQDGYLDLKEIKEIEVDESQVSRYLLQYEDILLTEGGDFDKLGRGSIWHCQIKPCLHQNHVFVVRTDRDKLNCYFFSQQISSFYGKAYFLSCAKQTTNLASINSTQLKEFPVLLPPLPEQRKIVEILSSWDKAIALLEQLITAKCKLKQGLMQQLLTGKKRFKEFIPSEQRQKTRYGSLPSDWEYVTIGEVAKEYSQKNKQAKNLTVLSCSKHQGLVNSLEYFGKQIFSEDTSTYKIVKCGMFAYATNHIDEGSIGYQNLCNEALISPMYTVFTSERNRIDDLFMYSVLKTEHYRQIFSINTSASVDRRGSLRWNEFAKIQIPLPSKNEQQKIASILSIADTEISTLEKQLAAYKQQKRGLMQQLLTGKKRVKLK